MRLTPEQFGQVCAANPEAVLELDADGHLITITPTGGETSIRNGELLFQLKRFASEVSGWKVFDSSGGFLLADGSVRSPDASVVRLERWQALAAEQRRGFAPLCPDLVVELASPDDEGPRGVSSLRRKMAAYQANGALLGCLLLHDLLRNAVAFGALAIGFAGLARRPGQPISLLQEWQFRRQQRLQQRLRRRAAARTEQDYLRQPIGPDDQG